MKLPECVYQKAFWIVVPMLVVAFSSGIAAIDGEINGIDDRLRTAEIKMANNDVPALKSKLNDIDEKIDALLINQARIETFVKKNLP